MFLGFSLSLLFNFRVFTGAAPLKPSRNWHLQCSLTTVPQSFPFWQLVHRCIDTCTRSMSVTHETEHRIVIFVKPIYRCTVYLKRLAQTCLITPEKIFAQTSTWNACYPIISIAYYWLLTKFQPFFFPRDWFYILELRTCIRIRQKPLAFFLITAINQ